MRQTTVGELIGLLVDCLQLNSVECCYCFGAPCRLNMILLLLIIVSLLPLHLTVVHVNVSLVKMFLVFCSLM